MELLITGRPAADADFPTALQHRSLPLLIQLITLRSDGRETIWAN